MKSAFTLQLGDESRDILIEAEPTDTIGGIARYILENAPFDVCDKAKIVNPTLLVNVSEKLVMHAPTSEYRDANIQNGAKVQLVSFIFDEQIYYTCDVYGILIDSESGFAYPLIDELEVGSGIENDVQIISKNQNNFDVKQFRINLSQAKQNVVIKDLSTDKSTVYSAKSDEIIVYGHSFQIKHFAMPIVHNKLLLKFDNWHNRYKILPDLLEEETFELPNEPTKPQASSLPIAMMITPLIMGAVMYFLMPNPNMVLFMLMSPIMMLGNYLNSKTTASKKSKKEQKAYETEREDVEEVAAERQKNELNILQKRYDTFNNTELWSKHFQDEDFLKINIGYGTYESKTKLGDSTKNFEGMPHLVDISDSLGIWGENIYLTPFLSGLLLQIVRYFSPSELQIVIFAGKYSKELEWLKWVQNVDLNHVAYSRESERKVLDALFTSSKLSGKHILAIIIDISSENWHILENAINSEELKLYAIWVSNAEKQLSWCAKTRLKIIDQYKAISFDALKDKHQQIENFFTADPQYCEDFTKSLANMHDLSETPVENVLIPKSISLSQIIGEGFAKNTHLIVENWSNYNTGLSCVIGMGGSAPFELDIQKNGPHALVGGTTGSGKSEFLQTWVLSLALNVSPNRVNFLLVDYKGGAAFANCVSLPHTVGLVTDLNVHLCKRVMISLKAELHRRELLLNEKKVKNLSELHKLHPDVILPFLVIVVDEFAALAVDLPEFVDQIVDIAARGRSLGVHLIMATQRPSGVIKDNLKANTNLRIALRVADESESKDIIQNERAALIKRETPGRLFVKIDTLTPLEVQCAYIGNTLDGKRASIKVSDFRLVNSSPWGGKQIESTPSGQHFLDLCVKQIQYAYMEKGLPKPYRPWKDQLPENVIYSAKGGVAVIDKPHIQDQVDFDSLENVLIYGKAGSGKTTALETWAMHNLLNNRQSDGGVYFILYTNTALDLSFSDNCEVIRLKDLEKMYRLFSNVINHNIKNSTILIDGIDILKEHLEQANLYDLQNMFSIMLAQSSSAKIQVICTLSKVNGIYSNWSSNFTKQIYFALASENEYSYAGVDQELLQQSNAGRGILDGEELQMKRLDFGELEKTIKNLPSGIKLPTLENIYPYTADFLGVDIQSLQRINFCDMVEAEHIKTIFIIGGRKSGKTSAVVLLKQLLSDANFKKNISVKELDYQSESLIVDSPGHKLDEGKDFNDGLEIITATPNILGTNWELKSQVNRGDLSIILDTNADVAGGICQVNHTSFNYCENSPGRGFLVYENESRLIQLSFLDVN